MAACPGAGLLTPTSRNTSALSPTRTSASRAWSWLAGTAPGPALYLLEPFLDAEGRRAYKKRLIAGLQELAGLEGRCDDGGRLARIQKAITVTLTTLDTIRAAKKES